MTQLQTGKYPLPWLVSVSKYNTNKILSREWFSHRGSRTYAAYIDDVTSAINKIEQFLSVMIVARFQEIPGSRLYYYYY
jgi:hypothetical protein